MTTDGNLWLWKIAFVGDGAWGGRRYIMRTRDL